MRNKLKRIPILVALMGMLIAVPGIRAQGQPGDRGANSGRMQDRIAKEVRHRLVMLPNYTVFDNLTFDVHGPVVTLAGQVTQPVLKSDAQNSVRRIEGVERVDNQIEVLPLSPMDDRIRRSEFRAIYGTDSLGIYARQPIPPIHIIVNGGHVTLEGVVSRQMDKTVANLRANSVPGVFSVQNNLQVSS